jgi:lipoyl synthase
VEVLTPDFKGVHRDLDTVLDARPDVFNHNLETVRRLQKAIRPAADYDRSLAVLGYVAGRRQEKMGEGKGSGFGVDASDAKHSESTFINSQSTIPRPQSLATIAVKSGLMVGLGETDEEILEAMADLRSVGVELLTIGQYLAPSGEHACVQRYVPPAQFDEYARRGMAMGFRHVASGPMVRSSYMAEEHFRGKTGDLS